MTHTGQQHPISLYLKIWGLLFVLSTLSYLVDYFHLAGYLRWSLILLFMLLKAGLIVAIFMHMAWERLALAYAMLVPPVLVLVFVIINVLEILLRRGGNVAPKRLFEDHLFGLSGDVGSNAVEVYVSRLRGKLE